MFSTSSVLRHVRQSRGRFGARIQFADRWGARAADDNAGKRGIRPARRPREFERSLLARAAAVAPDKMDDNKYRSSAPRKQSCRLAKRRARAPHSTARDCSLLPACSLLTVTLFFTSARFVEAIIGKAPERIYPKFAVKLNYGTSLGTLNENR